MALACSTVLVAAPASSAASGTTAPTGFTQTQTMSRSYVDNGVAGIDNRTVTLDVSDTSNLRGRQEIDVSWSGAHPTGNIVSDQNADDAQEEEYPFVLLECRGGTSATDPVSPSTCWTQSWNERFQDTVGNAYPPYRLDADVPVSDREAAEGQPAPADLSKTEQAACTIDLGGVSTQYWVPWDAANGTVYYGGDSGCAGEPPEASNVGGSELPSNETFGVTGLDGKGSAEFDIFTADENATMGCSQTVACSLVAVPIMGINCDAAGLSPLPTAAQLAQCESTGASAPGSLASDPPTPSESDLTVSGSLWWSASNWQNRIVVPLTFAPLPGSCPVVSNENRILVYGSELMFQATSQWEPEFCFSDAYNFSFTHVQTGEPQARNLVATGSAEAAFTSFAQPLGYGKPVVNAPVGVTGFAISYSIDGANGQPYTTLKLTPLLLAKLLTESYPGSPVVKEYDPALANNPLNITDDPEFIALNPGIAKNPNGLGNTEAEAELMALSSDSDVIQALTTYITDDPTARAWLNGTPDQWGMVVNPAYKGIALPVDQWPLLSTFEPTQWYKTDNNDCLFNDPVPYLPLISAPLATLADISEDLQYNLPNSTTTCSEPNAPSTTGEKLVAGPQQEVGYQFEIGITTLADAERYQLQTASLQTTTDTFVPPDNASLEATTALVKPDATSGSWPIPYPELEQSAGAAAYPGTMVVYAAVPTKGLPSDDAADYATLLRFAATTGQTPGTGVGQLPSGYLPMTAADGLGDLANYTLEAADDVAAQNGLVPSLSSGAGSDKTGAVTDQTGAGADAGATGPSAVGAYGEAPTDTAPFSSAASTAAERHIRTVPKSEAVAVIQPSGRTIGLVSWAGESVVLLLAVLGCVGLFGVPMLLLLGRRRGRW
jgi:hypothetical protein